MDESFDGVVTVRFIRYTNEATGWAVVDAVSADGSPVVLVGPLVHLEQGERAQIVGDWVDDSRYGPQVKAQQARPLPPEDPAVLVGYLKRVKHVGAKRAQQLVDAYGPEDVLDRIDGDPERAIAGVGLSANRLQEAVESWQAIRVTRRLHLLLAPHGLAYLAARIHEQYGADAPNLIGANPYELTSVFGVGFLIADRIAHATGPGGPSRGTQRQRAAILHALSEAERSGSTCLPLAELFPAARQLLGEDPAGDIVDELERRNDVVREHDWIYRAATAELEAELAERVARLIAADPSARLHAPDVSDLDRPTDEQRGALAAAFEHRLSVITGGPGTGKTVSIKSIASAAVAQRARVLLVAPTGRAAVRMTEASGVRARTVHSALGWVPGEGPTARRAGSARLRSADRRRDVDGESRAARDAAAGGG